MAESNNIQEILAGKRNEILENAELLYDASDVDKAIDRLAAEISDALDEKHPIVVSALIGGIIVTGRLLSRLKIPCELSYVHISRYQNNTRGGEVYWIAPIYGNVKNRVVLVVDDILDEGTTLFEIEKHLLDSGAAQVFKAVLVKKHRSEVITTVDFFGLEVPDRYVFGCGMDYKGLYRNLPEIYALGKA